MKIYLVGGAVRDKLLGWSTKERDFVVVGGTVEEMLQQGFKQVGKEFPVFLHPKTGEEYALARMERKVKPGYTGFTFDTSPKVTLEEDLIRRDLTINAMAETLDGKLIDPYHGKEDLEKKILRHVSSAFAEDPVRILRIARFYARYAHLGFHIANETKDLMREMVQSGEVNALVAERVWKELERALSEKNPENFFVALEECGALAILFPHLQLDGPGIKALQIAAKKTSKTNIRFAALLHTYPEGNANTAVAKEAISTLCRRYRVPNAYRELALLTAQYHSDILNSQLLTAEVLLDLLMKIDVFRREDRFKDLLIVCEVISQMKSQCFDSSWLMKAAQIVKSIDVQSLIAQGFRGQELAQKLKETRKEKLEEWIKSKMFPG